VIAPTGEQHVTGADPIALAISASGKVLVTVNQGSGRPSLTVMERRKTWETTQLPAAAGDSDDRWRSVARGLAFSGEHSVFVSEGNTGRVAVIDLEIGERRRALEIDPKGFTGDLAFDALRSILYVADPPRSRLIALDVRSRQKLASLELPGPPGAMALSPDRSRLYVAVARNLVREAGPPGDGVCVVDVAEPRAVHVEAEIRAKELADAAIAALVATPDRVFVSDAAHDSIAVINSRTRQIEEQIAIRVPGLEAWRGVLPMGMAFEVTRGWLLVAEAGINAVGIIDIHTGRTLGHVPVGWFPTQVVLSRGVAYVANRKGAGVGPSTRGSPGPRGSVSMFSLPDLNTLTESTRLVLAAGGFTARPGMPPPLPGAIRHVVLILKSGLTYDEILGDVSHAGNGTAMGAPSLARFGRDGYVDGRHERLSLHHLNVTPNHHAIAARWTFSDNFYADADADQEGVHWLAAWGYLVRHGVTIYRFGDGFDPKTADTERARRIIEELDAKFARPGEELPGLVMIHLPNDRMAPSDPASGFPYAESYLADNDFALGRILEYLSETRWWSRMAVFVTEASSGGGVDHIDANRTILLCAGPWARKNSVSHANASFPALRKTIFRLLGVPPLTLQDASSADLSGCFTNIPDTAPYRALPVDPRVYRP